MFKGAKSGKALRDVIVRLQARIAELERRRGGRSEEASRMRLLSSVVEQADDAVMITDRAGRIIYVNPAFERWTGYTQEEATGQNPRIVRSGEQGEVFYTDLWKTISEGRVFRGTLVNRKKSGERYYEEKTITPLEDANGAITYYVSTGKDITSRMQVEEERNRLAAILEVTTDLVAIATVQGKMVYLNRAGRARLGFGEAEILSRIVLPDLYPDWARARIVAEGDSGSDSDRRVARRDCVCRQGTPGIPISQVILAHHAPFGEIEYLSTIARDISDRKAQTAGP